jgi:hypothetical protein
MATPAWPGLPRSRGRHQRTACATSVRLISGCTPASNPEGRGQQHTTWMGATWWSATYSCMHTSSKSLSHQRNCSVRGPPVEAAWVLAQSWQVTPGWPVRGRGGGLRPHFGRHNLNGIAIQHSPLLCVLCLLTLVVVAAAWPGTAGDSPCPLCGTGCVMPGSVQALWPGRRPPSSGHCCHKSLLSYHIWTSGRQQPPIHACTRPASHCQSQ